MLKTVKCTNYCQRQIMNLVGILVFNNYFILVFNNCFVMKTNGNTILDALYVNKNQA